MLEIWRKVPGWPYLVSDEGAFLNLRTMMVNHTKHTGYALSYPVVLLRDGGRRLTVGKHIVIAEAFHGPKPDGYIVHHIDHDKSNFIPFNLEYVTSAENIRLAWQFHRKAKE